MSQKLLLRCLFMAMLVVIAYEGHSQDNRPRRGSRVIDDTTKQIYGPRTSRYFYEQDVFYNRDELHRIDTAINNFHKFDYNQRYGNLYQDLGVIGTAIQPIYYKTPDVIGVRSGAPVYDLYWDSEQVRYYDTKSPYSNMRVILGGRGRSITRATYSRNINPQWNFGFTYRAIYIDKQIQRKRADRIVRGNYYDFFTTYQTKDSTYRVFFSHRRNFHRVSEFGGVKLDTTRAVEFKDFFDQNAQPWLMKAESNDLRMNTHLFHQYNLVKKNIQVYHIFDRYRQQNKFLDVVSAATADYFDYYEIPRDSAKDVSKFKAFRNEVGLKGSLSGKLFYNGYVAIRHFSNTWVNFAPDSLPHITYFQLKLPATVGNEKYLGGKIQLFLDSIGEVNGWVETMTGGNFRIQGDIKSRWFEARVQQMKYAPGFIEQAYRGAHDIWNNDFASTDATQFNGYLHYRSKIFSISPGLTFTRLHNYIFYKELTTDADAAQRVLPVQAAGDQIFAAPELKLSCLFFRHLFLGGQAIYTRIIENSEDAIQVPQLLVNAQLSYANIFFNGNLDMHAGVDLYWKSAYYAPGYDPAIRQFYVQGTTQVPAYTVVDLFFNAKIKRGRVFFKYHNFLQAFQATGYLPTPGYPGQQNVFDFGFDWSFYD